MWMVLVGCLWYLVSVVSLFLILVRCGVRVLSRWVLVLVVEMLWVVWVSRCMFRCCFRLCMVWFSVDWDMFSWVVVLVKLFLWVMWMKVCRLLRFLWGMRG